jgi:hypothetical protein
MKRNSYIFFKAIVIGAVIALVLGGCDNGSGDGGPGAPVFTLTNISTTQQSEGSAWFVFGLFATGTARSVVVSDATAHYTNSSQPSAALIAYAGGESSKLPFTGLSTENASISSPLTARSGGPWTITDPVTYDAWVALYNGTTWTTYKCSSLTVSGENVTKSAATDFGKVE